MHNGSGMLDGLRCTSVWTSVAIGHVELHELLATNPHVSDASDGMLAVLMDVTLGYSAPDVCWLSPSVEFMMMTTQRDYQFVCKSFFEDIN